MQSAFVFGSLPDFPNKMPQCRTRETLGTLALAENLCVSLAAISHQSHWKPEFRNQVSEGIQMWALVPEVTEIALSAIIHPQEQTHLEKYYGNQVSADIRLSPRDAFAWLQPVRACEFAAVASRDPWLNLEGPLAIQKLSLTLLDLAHPWILGTTTQTSDSMSAAEKIVTIVLHETIALFNYYLRKEASPD